MSAESVISELETVTKAAINDKDRIDINAYDSMAAFNRAATPGTVKALVRVARAADRVPSLLEKYEGRDAPGREFRDLCASIDALREALAALPVETPNPGGDGE